MFKSQLSGKQYDAGVKPKRVVVETRPQTYNNAGKITFGTEIVRELLIGPDETVSA